MDVFNLDGLSCPITVASVLLLGILAAFRCTCFTIFHLRGLSSLGRFFRYLRQRRDLLFDFLLTKTLLTKSLLGKENIFPIPEVIISPVISNSFPISVPRNWNRSCGTDMNVILSYSPHEVSKLSTKPKWSPDKRTFPWWDFAFPSFDVFLTQLRKLTAAKISEKMSAAFWLHGS